MKIVQLVIGGEVAGGQVVALELARAARTRGDDVVFAAPRPGPFSEALAGEGFPVRFADLNRTFNLRAARGLRSLLRDAELLHTHGLAASNVLSRLVSPVPVIAHLHIENHFRAPTEPVLRRLDNATARRCARLVAVSEDTRRAYVRQGYPAERIEVIYNGVRPPSTGAAGNGDLRAELDIPPGAPLIGEIARLCAVKGQRELIAALTLLDPRVRLLLVGKDLEQGGAFEVGLRQEAERLGVGDRVVFAGFRDDVGSLLEELDVLVLPSWTEGLPLIVLEAMTHGRPVVATPVGGTPEVVADGETGLLVPPRDPAGLAEAIGRLLAEPELRARMGEAGRSRVAERFSADEMTRRVLEVYDEVAR